MTAFATVTELIERWKPLTAEEQTRATKLLEDVSNLLRYEARKCNKDLDEMIGSGSTLDIVYQTVVKDVTCDIVRRIMCQNPEGEALSQFSQSALGYTVSGTYSIPGGGGLASAIMKNDLKRLGLRIQRAGKVSMI